MTGRHIFKKNLIAIVMAAVLTSVMLLVKYNPDLFKASILGIQDAEMMQKNNRDIGYKTVSGTLDIFLSDKHLERKDVSINVLFDPKVIFYTQSITGQFTPSITNMQNDMLTLKIHKSNIFDPKNSLVIIPFSGDIKHVLIGESYIYLADGTKQSLAVGHLANILYH